MKHNTNGPRLLIASRLSVAPGSAAGSSARARSVSQLASGVVNFSRLDCRWPRAVFTSMSVLFLIFRIDLSSKLPCVGRRLGSLLNTAVDFNHSSQASIGPMGHLSTDEVIILFHQATTQPVRCGPCKAAALTCFTIMGSWWTPSCEMATLWPPAALLIIICVAH